MALFYEEWHTEARETILWLHGAGVSGWLWGPQIDRLPEYHHLVPDLPEHGKSQQERRFSISKLTEQLARLIEQHAHYSRAHVVGQGLGAQVALELVQRCPDRVARVILVAPLVRPPSDPSGPVERLVTDLSLRGTMALRNLPFRLRKAMRAQGIPERYRAEFAADTRRLTLGALHRAVRQEQRGLALPQGLEQSAVPTLLVAGSEDPPLVRTSALELIGALPSARAALAEGLGQAWNLQDPDRYAAMVRAWLTEQPLPQGLVPLTL